MQVLQDREWPGVLSIAHLASRYYQSSALNLLKRKFMLSSSNVFGPLPAGPVTWKKP